MNKILPLLFGSVAIVAGCASSPPAGLMPGKFVSLACAENKSFQVRMSEDGRTARVRSHHGAAELERQADGLYSGEGYVLNLGGEGGASLVHSGKSQGQACKKA